MMLRAINALPDSLADRTLHLSAAITGVYERLGLIATAGTHAPTLISLGSATEGCWDSAMKCWRALPQLRSSRALT
jgi:hypothetical protein